MKTNKYKFLLGFVLIALSISCSKDWLEIEQKGSILEEEFYSTDDECLSALAAVYDVIQTMNAADWSSLYHIKTVLSDEVNGGGADAGDQPEYHEMNEYTFTAGNTKINDVWEYLYYAIYRANVVLQNVEETNDNRTVIRAEAKALRAYLYFELVTLYGDVPLVLTVLEPEEYFVEKSTSEQIYAQIEADLTDAIAELPYRVDLDDQWRIAKGFAQALLGKSLVFQEKYSEALPYLKAVIDREGTDYSLVDDYDRVLRSENEYGLESLFEIGYVTTEGHNWSNYGYWGDGRSQEQNIHWILCGPRGDNFEGASLGMFDGWGALPAKETAFNFFNDDDPRRAGNVLSEDEVIAAGSSLRDEEKDELQYQGEGYLRMKYTTFTDEASTVEGDEPGLNIGTNLRIMRYAEVLLLAAEAHIGANGDGGLAAAEINKLRVRADGYTPLATATMEDVKYERAVELCFEGHRFYDLVRWGDAVEALGELGFEEKHSHLPIPSQELDANPNLVQNTPWL